VDEQQNKGGLHNDIVRPPYGMGAGVKRKVLREIDGGGRNLLEFK
jgi:hypothetical protein